MFSTLRLSAFSVKHPVFAALLLLVTMDVLIMCSWCSTRKRRAPDIAAVPTNAATRSARKVDHCGPYANERGGGSEEVEIGKEGTTVREKAGWGRGKTRGKEEWSGGRDREMAPRGWSSLIWSNEPVIHRGSFVPGGVQAWAWGQVRVWCRGGGWLGGGGRAPWL